MSAAPDPGAADQLTIGPIKVIEMYVSLDPDDVSVVEPLGTDNVPFDEVRHLVSSKPLERYEPAQTAS